MLQAVVLVLKTLYLGGARLTLRVAQKPLLPGLQKLLGPAVVQIRSEPLAAAQSRNALFPTQSFEDDPDFLFRRKTTSCLALNVADDLLRAFSLSHRILLPFGPGVSLISSTYLVQPSLNPNTYPLPVLLYRSREQ